LIVYGGGASEPPLRAVRWPSEPKTMIKTKSVKSSIEPRADGLRILATRFRGRGLPSSRYDVWMPNLGPSETLLHDMRAGAITWAEFGHRYRKERTEGGGVDQRNRTIKNHGQKFTLRLIQELGRRGTVTLLCHCAEDEQHCHRHVLKKVLARRG
jgi:uncharacterized protein YeaO (DUF488 family)